MAGFIKGPARGRSLSRMKGTKVTLEGQTVFLPNDDTPAVFQRLTMRQIVAIPKDRFSVSLVEMVEPKVMPTASHKRQGTVTNRKLQKMKKLVRLASETKVTGYIRKPVSTLPIDTDGTKKFITIISKIDDIKEDAKDLYDINLALSRNQRDTPPEPDSGIFFPPIDDGSMSDCIKKAIVHFFGEKKICKVNGTKYKPAAFCLLMYDYFKRMCILNNTTLTHFGDFLQKRVLMKEMQFSSRTLTNYAKEFKDYEMDFTNRDRLKINFNTHPEPGSGKPVHEAFQEIGNFFHTSEYFTHLRELRNNMNKFQI